MNLSAALSAFRKHWCPDLSRVDPPLAELRAERALLIQEHRSKRAHHERSRATTDRLQAVTTALLRAELGQ